MHHDTDEPGTTPADAPRKDYERPVLSDLGAVRDVTLTNASGPNFDGGGGQDIYAS